MKSRYLILIVSGALFLLAYFYYVIGENEPTHQDRRELSPAKRSAPVPSRQILDKGPPKKEIAVTSAGKMFFSEDEILTTQNKVCKDSYKPFEENPDFVDVNSDFYKNELAMKDKAEMYLSQYQDSLNLFQASYTQKYQQISEDPSLTPVSSWLAIEENFSGCGKEADIGVFMLTIAEAIKKEKVKSWFLIRAIRLAQTYLNFGTISGQIYAVGILKNLVVSNQIKGYMVHELYALGEDIDRQAFNFREFLYQGEEGEALNTLKAHIERKKAFEQRIRDIMEEIKLRQI